MFSNSNNQDHHQSDHEKEPRLYLNPVVDFQRESAEAFEIVASDFSRVLVIYTGGTIGMRAVPGQGYVPVRNGLSETLKATERFNDSSYWNNVSSPLRTEKVRQYFDPSGSWDESHPAITERHETALVTPFSLYGKRIRYTILEYQTLLDSSNMNFKDWIRIASDIELNYHSFDAFLVLHGTDTMAYTASALSFMLENLGKPVILTGSQVPLAEWRTDAEANLLGALLIASHFVIPEVCIFFGQKLFRGNRCTKIDAMDFVAFDSPNLKPLAVMGVNIDISWTEIKRPHAIARFAVEKNLNPNVAALRLFPGITESTVSAFLAPPIQGVVLETFGAGNAPDNRPELLRQFDEAIKRGVVIVNCSQCKKGVVSDSYATGKALTRIGVIAGNDMTTECALTKLAYLLGKGRPVDMVKSMLQMNLRGEMTISAMARKGHSFHDFQQTCESLNFIRSVIESLKVDTISEQRIIENALLPNLICATAGVGNEEEFGHLKCVFANDGSLVNATDFNDRTALHIAASCGHYGIVKSLLECGASVHLRDKEGKTPLLSACIGGHRNVAKLLFDAGAYFDSSDETIKFEVLKAIITGNLNSVRLFNECGYDLAQNVLLQFTPVALASMCSHVELFDYLDGIRNKREDCFLLSDSNAQLDPSRQANFD